MRERKTGADEGRKKENKMKRREDERKRGRNGGGKDMRKQGSDEGTKGGSEEERKGESEDGGTQCACECTQTYAFLVAVFASQPKCILNLIQAVSQHLKSNVCLCMFVVHTSTLWLCVGAVQRKLTN